VSVLESCVFWSTASKYRCLVNSSLVTFTTLSLMILRLCWSHSGSPKAICVSRNVLCGVCRCCVKGIIGGTLLVTCNTVMFDPSVSDPLVLEHGPDDYHVAAPLKSIMQITIYEDIAAKCFSWSVGFCVDIFDFLSAHVHDDARNNFACRHVLLPFNSVLWHKMLFYMSLF